MSDRPQITITDGAGNGASASAPAPSAYPHQDGAATAPEAQPPVTMPPQELEPTIGGPALPIVEPNAIVQAEGGSLADQLRARFDKIAATEEFPVPGWERENGEPGLIVVARTFGDRKAFNQGLSNEAFIARSTHQLFFVDDAGKRTEIEGGWGPKLAAMMGVQVPKAADLVSLVISKPDPRDPRARIPNVAGIGALATSIINWAGRGQRDAEDELGG